MANESEVVVRFQDQAHTSPGFAFTRNSQNLFSCHCGWRSSAAIDFSSHAASNAFSHFNPLTKYYPNASPQIPNLEANALIEPKPFSQTNFQRALRALEPYHIVWDPHTSQTLYCARCTGALDVCEVVQHISAHEELEASRVSNIAKYLNSVPSTLVSQLLPAPTRANIGVFRAVIKLKNGRSKAALVQPPIDGQFRYWLKQSRFGDAFNTMSASDIVDILPSGNAALPAFIPIVQKAAGIHFRNTVSSFSRCGLKGSSLDNLIKSSTSEASAAAGSMLMSESTMNRQASTAAFLVAVPLMALYKQRQSADPTPIFNLSSNQRRHLRRLYALAESTTEAEESVDISEIPAELVSATSCFLESLAIGEIQPSATQAPAMIQLAAALCISKSSQSQVEPHLASPRLTHLANSLRMLWLAPHLRSLEAALDDSCLQTSILAEVQKQRSRLLLYSSPIQAISHRCSLARKVAATRPSPKRTIWSEDRLWVTPPAPNARPIEWTKVKTTVQGLICEVARLMSYAFNVPPTDLLDIVLPTNIDDRSASVPFVDKVPGDFITQLWSDYHISISNDETLGSLFDRLVLAFACANHACCGQPGRLPQLLTTSLVNTEIDPKSLFWDSFRQVFYWVGTSSKGRASFVAYELPASLSKLLFLFCCVRLRILSRLQNQVCDQSASSPYLFSFSSGSRVTPDEVAAMFVKCFQDSTGQPVSPASFRHLTISRFVQNSRNETRMVARVLKGEDVSTEDFLATLRETVSLAEKRNRKLTDAELCARMRDASRRYHEELDLTPDHADEQIQNHQGRWFGHKESCPSASETDSDEFLYENPIQDSSDEESSYEGGAENLEAVSSDEDTI